MLTNSSKVKQYNQKIENAIEQVEKYFPGFLPFIDCTEQQIPRSVDKHIRKTFCFKKKKKHEIKTAYG